MAKWHILASGVVGATTLTLLHEGARKTVPHAPRVDILGMRAIARSMRAADQIPPSNEDLYYPTLIGDLVSNSLYYSLVAIGDRRYLWYRGALLGLAGGVGTVLASRLLDLGPQPGEQSPTTQLMTIAWYLVGGLAAAATTRQLATISDD
jgi:hypothetical protein